MSGAGWETIKWRSVSAIHIDFFGYTQTNNHASVIQRQSYLLHHTSLTPAAAYDKARRELYRLRHYRETETRVAREEAMATGAYFGPGPLEIGMMLEDKAYADWKRWAQRETDALKALQSSAYQGAEAEENEISEVEADGELQSGEEKAVLEEVGKSVPNSRRGQEALGGQVARP